MGVQDNPDEWAIFDAVHRLHALAQQCIGPISPLHFAEHLCLRFEIFEMRPLPLCPQLDVDNGGTLDKDELWVKVPPSPFPHSPLPQPKLTQTHQ